MKNNGSSLGLNVSIINRAARGYFQRRLKEFSVGPGQQAYLLSLLPGETIVQDRLASRLKVDKANVSRAVKSLEKLGYLKRSRSSENLRAWNISLTDEGIMVRASIEIIAGDWIELLKKPLPREDWSRLESCLQILADSLQAEE